MISSSSVLTMFLKNDNWEERSVSLDTVSEMYTYKSGLLTCIACCKVASLLISTF